MRFEVCIGNTDTCEESSGKHLRKALPHLNNSLLSVTKEGSMPK